ncbi:MAG: phosphatidylinositol mannoside acyltransferase [Acidimicrobiales bacterium]
MTDLRARVNRARKLPPAYLALRGASRAASLVPDGAAVPLARAMGWVAATMRPGRAELVARHQGRVLGPLSGPARRQRTREAFASYGRYWVESMRVGAESPDQVSGRFTIEGLGHIRDGLARGTGALLAIPHVGGWDVGGAWLVAAGVPMTVVVEALEPPEVADWFEGLRRQLGFGVLRLGPSAGTGVVRALRANRVVALMADRDLVGGGPEVTFFGERTTLPAGPVALARRFGVPLLPTAIYFHGPGHHAVVGAPLDVSGKEDQANQRLADALEALIRAAPAQWHLFSPNWPSDRG